MDVSKMERKKLVALTTCIVSTLLLGGFGFSNIRPYNYMCDNIQSKARIFIPKFGELKLINENDTVKSCQKSKEYLIPHSNAHVLICKYDQIEGLNIELYINNTVSILNMWTPKNDIISFVSDILQYSI